MLFISQKTVINGSFRYLCFSLGIISWKGSSFFSRRGFFFVSGGGGGGGGESLPPPATQKFAHFPHLEKFSPGRLPSRTNFYPPQYNPIKTAFLAAVIAHAPFLF